MADGDEGKGKGEEVPGKGEEGPTPGWEDCNVTAPSAKEGGVWIPTLALPNRSCTGATWPSGGVACGVESRIRYEPAP